MPLSSAWLNNAVPSQAQLFNSQSQPGPAGRNIEIDQRIIGSKDARALCTLVETCVADFNHVNVATAFRKLLPLQGRHDVASRG